MTTTLQPGRRISPEITSVVNNHRDWRIPVKPNGEEITRRRQIEKKLPAVTGPASPVNRISHGGSWGWHVSTGAVYCSREHLRIFGFDPEKVKPSYSLFLERIHPADRPLFEQMLHRSVWESGDFEHDYRIILPDGSTRFLRSAGRSFVNQSGEREFIGTVLDITDLKRVEEIKAAVAREREVFGQQRAAELAKANDGLGRYLDSLASAPEPDEFLGQIMGAITSQLGAVSSTLRLCDFEKNLLTLRLVFQNGRLMSPAEAGYPEAWRFWPLGGTCFDCFDPLITIQRVADPQATIPETERAYLLGLGVKTILLIPLKSRGYAVGRLSLRFGEDRDFCPEELEIVRALATQATLAIQLTRLANTARQSGVQEERNRLAGEIHDSLGQSFVAISMLLDVAEYEMAAKGADPLCHIARAKELAKFGLAEARRTALSLHPFFLDKIGLSESVQMLVERSNVPGRLQCSFLADDSLTNDLPLETQQNLLRIAQEAISNAVRHANPTTISVSLHQDSGYLELEIRDDGGGISATQLLNQKGLGLTNMQNRAKKIGASLDIRPGIGGGTAIIVTLPINTQTCQIKV